MTISRLTGSQNQCPPVTAEFGYPLNLGLMTDPDLAEVVTRVAADLEATYARTKDIKKGSGAAAAVTALGCLRCDAKSVCVIGGILEGRVLAGDKLKEVARKAKAIATSPPWLEAARLHRSPITSYRLSFLRTHTAEMRQALELGEFDAFLSVGGLVNEPAPALRADQLPETANLTVRIPPEGLPTQVIITGTGARFIAVDASEPLMGRDGLADNDLQQYRILCAKMVDRMAEPGPNGTPQIMGQDFTMQKLIRRFDAAELYEIRMTGKWRIYFTLARQPEGPGGPVARIIFLGGHGGDEDTQAAYISSIVAGKTRKR